MTLATTPRTWASGEVVTAAMLNSEVRDALMGIQAAWDTYTVAWTASTTNPVLGNGTLTGYKLQIGKTFWWKVVIVFGSTTTVGSGVYSLQLPATPAAGARSPVGVWVAFDTSASTTRMGNLDSGTTTVVQGMDFANVRLTASNPFAWATGDSLVLSGMFEST